MMLIKRLLLFILLCTNICFSQVGINTNNPSPASVLDVQSSVDNINYGGFMPPKVSLSERDMISVTAQDEGLIIYLSEVNKRCIQIYNSVDDLWEDVYCMPINDAPVAGNLSMLGMLAKTETLTAQFTYFDDENDPEGNHIYKWYKSSLSDGSSPVTLQSGINDSYILQNSDIGFYIGFSVEPLATQGASPGIEVLSAFDGLVTNAITPNSNLFISEYVEGSGNNKIIEIANFTGSSVNLANYKIDGYQNENSTIGSTYTFPSVNLSNGEVFVIEHQSSTYPGVSDATFGWQFNGDDAVVLRTTADVTIDFIGVVPTAGDFAKDKTLRKKPGVGPSTTYDANDYDSYPQDTFDGLGSHTF